MDQMWLKETPKFLTRATGRIGLTLKEVGKTVGPGAGWRAGRSGVQSERTGGDVKWAVGNAGMRLRGGLGHR